MKSMADGTVFRDGMRVIVARRSGAPEIHSVPLLLLSSVISVSSVVKFFFWDWK
jgi:hypothetical protein